MTPKFYFDKEWLTTAPLETKILTLVAILSEDNLAFRGRMPDICSWLSLTYRTENAKKILNALQSLVDKKLLFVGQDKKVFILALSSDAEAKLVELRTSWVHTMREYKADKGQSVDWSAILKVLVFIVDDITYCTQDDIAAQLNLSKSAVQRAIHALKRIDLGKGYFLCQDGEYVRIQGGTARSRTKRYLGIDFTKI